MGTFYPSVLFFINGPTPTPADLQAADRYGPGVKFRNANLINDEASLEDADAVAGNPPARYRDALPDIANREAVYSRMSVRNPGNAVMFGGRAAPTPYDQLSDAAKAELNTNDLARGAKPMAVNERLATAVPLSQRMSQAGEPQLPPEASWQGGWQTGDGNPSNAGGEFDERTYRAGEGTGDEAGKTGGAPEQQPAPNPPANSPTQPPAPAPQSQPPASPPPSAATDEATAKAAARARQNTEPPKNK